MKLVSLVLLMISFQHSAIGCEDPLYGMQISKTPQFEAKLGSLSTEGVKCRTIHNSEGDVAMNIAFTRKDQTRRSGLVTRNFTAFLLCTDSNNSEEYLYQQLGRAKYQFEYQDEDGTSCSGVTFRILKEVKI